MSLEANAVPGNGPGETLAGRYELGELLGRGGMADVYRATDLVLGRAVAVKALRDLAASEGERERFTAEARTLAALSHPNLVTVLDAGTAGDRPYLVMELVAGPTLAQCCSDAQMTLRESGLIGAQVAAALAYAHQRGIVHRDVKPSNVLLGEGNRVWLADFGIARLVDDAARHTSTGMTIGSPAYLSPEQVRGEDVTPAADVYSLGLVVLEMLTGKRAFGGTPTESALARLAAPPVVPVTLGPRWRDLLTAMTATDPRARPSAEEVERELNELALESGPTESLAADEPPTDVSTQAIEVAAQWTQDVPVAPRSAGDEHERREPATEDTGRRRPRVRPWAVALAACALAALAIPVATTLDDDEAPSTGEPIPAQVEPELREPLRNLHDAVNGIER